MTNTDKKQTTETPLKNSWGVRFKVAREAMGLSEKDAAARLHLKPHIIALIETENFEEGPPTIFMRGYIRSYGRMINLSEKEITQALSQLNFSTPLSPALSPQVRFKEPQDNNALIWSTVFIVLVLAGLVGMWWWNAHVRNTTVVETALNQTPEATPQPKATPQVATALPSIAPGTTNPIPGSTTTPGTQPTPQVPTTTPTTAINTPITTPAPVAPSPSIANSTTAQPTPMAAPTSTTPVTPNNKPHADATPQTTPGTLAKPHPSSGSGRLVDAQMSVPEEDLDNEMNTQDETNN